MNNKTKKPSIRKVPKDLPNHDAIDNVDVPINVVVAKNQIVPAPAAPTIIHVKTDKSKQILKNLKPDLIIELYKINMSEYDEYKITKDGQIWSVANKKFITPSIVDGYPSFNNTSIHRLVAKTFIENPNNHPRVQHINGNKNDNRIENLEWCVEKENPEPLPNLLPDPQPKQMTRATKVKQIDPKTGTVIKIFDQITLAANEVGVSRKAIQNVLNGDQKTAAGFKWELSEINPNHVIKADLSGSVGVYDYPNYVIFSDGRMYNTSTQRFLDINQGDADGSKAYYQLCRTGKKKAVYVSRIVADHFLPNKPDPRSEVHHINGDKTNNSVSNLKWGPIQKSIVPMTILNGPNAGQKSDEAIDDVNVNEIVNDTDNKDSDYVDNDSIKKPAEKTIKQITKTQNKSKLINSKNTNDTKKMVVKRI